MKHGWKAELKRYGAPVAFLAAVTIAVLLVRSGLDTRPAPVTGTVATTASTQTGTTAAGPHRPRFYRLKGGETLSDVALRFGTTVDTLLALNPHIKPYDLRVGQRVRVR